MSFNNHDFLYLKRALLFILEMTFLQHKDYLKKGMIWHVILFCTLKEETVNLRNKMHMLMHFNDTRMRIQVDVPLYFRDWNSDQTLFEETVSDINADSK